MTQAAKKHQKLAPRLTPQQLDSLRQLCRTLSQASGSMLPTELQSPEQIISALETLSTGLSPKGRRLRDVALTSHQVRAELENLERLKNKFIRNISHELRTPLASIDGFARALLRIESDGKSSQSELITPESRRQFLSIISQEAQRLGKLIEDVLDLSEIEANPPVREPSLFSTREVFADALKAAVADCGHIQVTERITPAPDGPAIYADRNAIVEVLRQLISNAQKFSAGQDVVLGAETVSITPTAPMATTSGQLPRVTTATRIYVRDRGVGIPAEELDRIFQKFYRIERPGFSVPGMGLGLSIVRALINQNNGQVWAESELNRGATFYVLLPDGAPGI